MEQERKKSKSHRWVTVRLQGAKARPFADTGCRNTLISLERYHKKMGKLVPAKRTLRSLGASDNLDTKGMIRTTVATNKGTT